MSNLRNRRETIGYTQMSFSVVKMKLIINPKKDKTNLPGA
jgi:hypothetical protein